MKYTVWWQTLYFSQFYNFYPRRPRSIYIWGATCIAQNSESEKIWDPNGRGGGVGERPPARPTGSATVMKTSWTNVIFGSDSTQLTHANHIIARLPTFRSSVNNRCTSWHQYSTNILITQMKIEHDANSLYKNSIR